MRKFCCQDGERNEREIGGREGGKERRKGVKCSHLGGGEKRKEGKRKHKICFK